MYILTYTDLHSLQSTCSFSIRKNSPNLASWLWKLDYQKMLPQTLAIGSYADLLQHLVKLCDVWVFLQHGVTSSISHQKPVSVFRDKPGKWVSIIDRHFYRNSTPQPPTATCHCHISSHKCKIATHDTSRVGIHYQKDCKKAAIMICQNGLL